MRCWGYDGGLYLWMDYSLTKAYCALFIPIGFMVVCYIIAVIFGSSELWCFPCILLGGCLGCCWEPIRDLVCCPCDLWRTWSENERSRARKASSESSVQIELESAMGTQLVYSGEERNAYRPQEPDYYQIAGDNTGIAAGSDVLPPPPSYDEVTNHHG